MRRSSCLPQWAHAPAASAGAVHPSAAASACRGPWSRCRSAGLRRPGLDGFGLAGAQVGSVQIGGVQVGAEPDEPGGVAPAWSVGGGVDDEFDHDLGVHAGVGQGSGGSAAPAGAGQRRRPRVSRTGVRPQHCPHGGLGGGGQVGAAPDDLQPAAGGVGAASSSTLGASTGPMTPAITLRREAGAEFLPAPHPRSVGLVGAFGDHALDPGCGCGRAASCGRPWGRWWSG